MIAHLDCSTGISGDKFLGALLDAGEAAAAAGAPGFSAGDLVAAVRGIAPEATVTVERVVRGGVSALTLRIEGGSEPPHRHWSDIRTLLEGAPLPEGARQRALAAFGLLAEAEAKVHGTTPESVHFHEVGSADSIADIVGVSLGLELLGVTRLVSTPVAVGSGTVATSHGVLPVPAPATAGLLVGLPVVPGPSAGELTTPTGAALVRAFATGFGALPAMVPLATGYGAGTRELAEAPNVARIVLGREPDIEQTGTEHVVLLETNLDHLSPEAVAFAAEELLSDGAHDVWCTPVVMKKGRSAVVLSVLVASEESDRLTGRIHALTGTLGVRRTPASRSVTARASFTLETPFGPVRVKAGAGRVRPEHDDVARVARETGRAYDDVARELTALALAEQGD